jgi:hypothetical protein
MAVFAAPALSHGLTHSLAAKKPTGEKRKENKEMRQR